MTDNEFEGSRVLEKLAEMGLVEDFFDAVDSDDFGKARSLMKKAGIDEGTMEVVIRKMQDADGEH